MEESTLRLEALPPELLRDVAALCIGRYDSSRAEVRRLRLTCKALLSAAEAALASGLVTVTLWPRTWPPPSMDLITRCARHLNLAFCREEVTDEAVRALAEAAPQLVELYLQHCHRVTDISPLASLRALTHLNLSGTGVEDVSSLAACTALRTLQLYDTKVKDTSALQQSNAALRIRR